jgi:hypothetical protein
MPAKTFEEAIEHLRTELGEVPERPIAEYDGWSFGERVRVLEDSEEVNAGDEGMLVIERVGSALHGSERICASILLDDVQATYEVGLSDLESA